MFSKYVISIMPLIGFVMYRYFTKNKVRDIKNNENILTLEKRRIGIYKPGLKIITEVENEDSWDIYDEHPHIN